MRISPRDIRCASKLGPEVGRMLRPCGSLDQARREWQWIRKELPRERWGIALMKRAAYVPLQYILGTQPFGDLSMKCKPDVLIPRYDTEEWVIKLAGVLSPILGPLQHGHLVDACTGSGCVALLLQHHLNNKKVSVIGSDISINALELARENAIYNKIAQVSFAYHDVTAQCPEFARGTQFVTANPPYVTPEEMTASKARNGVEKSVRMWEPRLALEGDLEYYTALVNNLVLPLGCHGFMFELGHEGQAEHVNKLLPPSWKVGTYHDSAGRIRCVSGWNSPDYDALSSICTMLYPREHPIHEF